MSDRKGSVMDKSNAFVRRGELEEFMSVLDRHLERRERQYAEAAGEYVMDAAMRHLLVVFLALLAVDAALVTLVLLILR